MTASAQGFVAPGTTKKGAGAKTWLAERAKLPPYAPPRMTDGKPDLQGRWGGSSSGDDIEETEQVDATTPPWESYVSNPADGRIPYQPWALAERNKHRAGLARGIAGETGEQRVGKSRQEALRGMRFGTVTLIVQDGVVIQVDRTEKTRVRREH